MNKAKVSLQTMWARSALFWVTPILRAGISLVFVLWTIRAWAYPNVDWKMYGAVNVGAGETMCFYDERGVAREDANTIRLWAKCLAQKEINDIHEDRPYWRAMVDLAGSRIAHNYIPPISRVEKIKPSHIATVIMYESIADVGDIEPSAQIYYEIDCRHRRSRELSITLNGYSSDKPRDWTYVPPESNGSQLLALVCKV